MLSWIRSLFSKETPERPLRHVPYMDRKTVECSCGSFIHRTFMEPDEAWHERVKEFLLEHEGEIGTSRGYLNRETI